MDLASFVAQGMTITEICVATGHCRRIVDVWLERQGLRARARENRLKRLAA